MIQIIKKYLLKLIDDIDAGNTDFTEEEGHQIINIIKDLSTKKKRMSKYAAYTYLNISRATFDNYVAKGLLPKGTHEAGFKELSWDKADLDAFIHKYKNKL